MNDLLTTGSVLAAFFAILVIIVLLPSVKSKRENVFVEED